MKKRTIVAVVLLLLLTTISSQKKIIISKFNLKKIYVENNFLLKEKDIKNLLTPFYEKNLIFLNTGEIEKVIVGNNYIESFVIKKKYPDTLIIKIFERKPIAVLFNKKKKFYLSENMDLIEFKSFEKFEELPEVYGDHIKFKTFYYDLKQINFPFQLIEKYILYESNRWNLETKNKKIIKLPIQNYSQSLKNFLDLKNKKSFKKYKVFDYRVGNQLILK